MRSFNAWLLCAILIVLLVGATGKGGKGGGGGRGGKGGSRSGGKGGSIFGSSSGSSGSRSRTITSGGKTRTYTYSSTSSRNYNNGARYYMRHSTVTSTSTFGYSYYRSGSYYYSGYGYRMYYPPTYYYPMYVGYSYYYYPPMFYYYHRSDRRYWNGNRPRYTCRNDNAFWPLENQTSEFVDGRPPAVDFNLFEQDLPDPDSNSNTNLNWDSPSSTIGKNLTELNSLEINENPIELLDDYSNEDASNSTDELETSTIAQRSTTTQQRRTVKSTTLRSITQPPSEMNRRKIMSYNYFVCPDGKDPDEVYCCGPSTAQYCCTYEEYSETVTLSTGAVTAIIVVAVVVLSAIYSLVHKFRHHCLGIPHSHHGVVVAVPGQTVVTTRETVEYIPAPDNDGSFGPGPQYAQGANPAAGVPPVYPTYAAGYQPVSDAPPSYAATQNPAAQPANVPTYPPPGAAIYPSAGVASYPAAPTNAPYPPSSTAMPYPAGPTGVPYPSLTSPTPYAPASSYLPASNFGQYPPPPSGAPNL